MGDLFNKTLSKWLGLISSESKHSLVFWEEPSDSDSKHDKVTQPSEAK